MLIAQLIKIRNWLMKKLTTLKSFLKHDDVTKELICNIGLQSKVAYMSRS